MQIRDRIRELRRVRAGDLRPHPQNWRVHPQSQQNALRGILSEIGYADALIATQCDDGGLMLIDGHLRAETTPDEMVPVLVTDLNAAEAAKLLTVLDPLAAIAEANNDHLKALLQQVESSNADVQNLLTDLANKNRILTDETLQAMSEAAVVECPPYQPPFQWFGGKSRVVPLVWDALGNVDNYAEPFFGAGHVLFRRPQYDGTQTETINDLDGFVANFWRAVRSHADEVAKWADWPVSENDLHARHTWLISREKSLRPQLEADPEWCDPKIAGWWVWGQCLWIGAGWCSGEGPWRVVDGKLVKNDGEEDGVKRKLPHLSDDGQGVHRKRPHLGDDGRGVHRNFPQIDGDRGIQRKHIQEGDNCQNICEFIQQSLQSYFAGLQDRLRRVRICCGDWLRIVKSKGITTSRGITGVFLDPPYAFAVGRDEGCYRQDDATVSQAVAAWCREHGDDPRFRIVLAGYEGEHEMPQNWKTVSWKAAGGMSNQGNNRGKANQFRERLWLSPHCFDVSNHPELDNPLSDQEIEDVDEEEESEVAHE